MPTFGDIILADGQATPVNHTFAAVVIDNNGVAHYEDSVGGIPIGYGRLSISLKRPSTSTAPGSNSKNAVYRVRAKIEIPVLEVTSPSTGSGIQPAPTVAYSNMGEYSSVYAARGVLQERKDVRTYMRNLFAHATFIAVNDEVKSIY
jgi:hypothetical protein